MNQVLRFDAELLSDVLFAFWRMKRKECHPAISHEIGVKDGGPGDHLRRLFASHILGSMKA